MKWINFIFANYFIGIITFYTNTQVHGRKWKTKYNNKMTFQQLYSRGDIEISVEQSDFLQHKYDKLLCCHLSKAVNSDPSSSLKKPEKNVKLHLILRFNTVESETTHFNQRLP